MCRLLLIFLNEIRGFIQDAAILWDEKVSVPLMNLKLLSRTECSTSWTHAFPKQCTATLMTEKRAWGSSYFERINQLNFSCQQQLVLQLWMDHIQCVTHRLVIDICILFYFLKKNDNIRLFDSIKLFIRSDKNWILRHLPYEMFRLIFFLVASLERTSLRIEMVEMLSDLKWPSPLLKLQISERKHAGF